MVQDEPRKTEEQSSTSEWRPRASTAGRTVGIASIVLAICSAAAWIFLLTQPVGLGSLFPALMGAATGLLALAAGTIAAAYSSMRYRLEDDRLTLSCLWMRELIPLGRIDGLYGGRRLGKRPVIRGLRWLGLFLGHASVAEVGELTFYGTTIRSSSVLLVTTSTRAYALTPAELDEFRAELVSRLEALSPEELERAPEPTSAGTPIPLSSLLSDGAWLALVGAALVASLASFVYVAVKIPGLPDPFAIHFNAAGQPDKMVPPVDVLRMPIIGILIFGFNGVAAAVAHTWQRDTGRVLAGATLFIELVALSAILRVVH